MEDRPNQREKDSEYLLAVRLASKGQAEKK
jgi:hypothetical protein